ncbi:2-oxoglutarate and iron-dependent oxygenase domain-containing protein [Shimia sp. SDUM112013]|uniref:isopenicillin N synthase family dioxygenase n=1 Tax=Shimia sp. SDUM112013 TaxID=3136160 RepID=UPI0032EB8598
MIPYEPPKPAEFIPVVDLQGSFSPDIADRQAVAQEIHKAARDTGFLYISNHGIPDAVLDRHLALAREFFALPYDEKIKIDGTGGYGIRGYETMGAQVLDSGAPSDLKEAFQMGVEIDRDHPWFDIAGQEVFNRWPARPEGFQTHFEDYASRMMDLGRHMMRMLALSLDLDEGYFDEGMAQPSMTSRLIHYPPQPEGAQANQIGAGAHTDWGTLTFLLQDDVGGLEVENAAGEWIAAPPIPGTFVVNLGDMIPVLTNGLYHSNMHRVKNVSVGRDRYSAPTFIDPGYTYVAECVPTCYPETGEPLFPPVTVIEHTSQKYYESYGGADDSK